MPDSAVVIQIFSGLWTLLLTILWTSYAKSQKEFKTMVVKNKDDIIKLNLVVVSEDKIREITSSQYMELKLAHEDIKDDLKIMMKEIHVMTGTLKAVLQEVKRGS